MPKVSVLIPVYNVEKYLRECLDSVINQTLKDIEIICINDGSTDGSLQILQQYAAKDKRITVISKANGGYGQAMNTGLGAAKGEYIGIIESDDFTEKNMFEDLYRLAKENNADIAKSDWFDYWTQGNKSRKAGRLDNFPKGSINARTTPNLVRVKPTIWSAIYKRGFLNQNGIRFLETPGASYQDTSFQVKCMLMAKSVSITPKAYVHYRQDNMGASRHSKAKVYCVCDEYNEVENYMQRHPETIEPFSEIVYAMRYRTYMRNLLRIDKAYTRDFIDRFQEEFKGIYQKGYCKDLFFKTADKTEFMALMRDKETFYRLVGEREKKEKRREARKNIISVKLNASRFHVRLFGKDIVRIG